MSDHNDPEFGFDKTAALSDPGPVAQHRPFADDGVTYCGIDGHEGCGELWPCSTIRALNEERQRPLWERYEVLRKQADALQQADALREQGTSETEPVSGTKSRPCNSIAHMALIGNYHGQIQTLAADLLAKDATIERLWRQLNEATNVPHERPGVAGPCLDSCDGQSAVWSTSDHLWRCTTCARIVGAKP